MFPRQCCISQSRYYVLETTSFNVEVSKCNFRAASISYNIDLIGILQVQISASASLIL